MKLLMAAVALAILAIYLSKGSSTSLRQNHQAAQADQQDLYALSNSRYGLGPLDRDQISKLAENLTSQEKHVLLEEGTEPPFTGALLKNEKKGIYTCRLCGLPLYDSTTKFKSGTGWPSFFKPIDPDHVREVRDSSVGVVRTEVECARCRSHLGHVFEDGPRPTGLRYCMNAAALKFHQAGAPLPPESRPAEPPVAYFAGGCFWGIEDRFQQVPGVIDAVSGYQGGRVPNPTYQQVCQSDTGHAETVRVAFDSNQVSYNQLLEWFFKFHDPTQKNRQGPDIGFQYRSAIFAADDQQLAQANAFVQAQSSSKRFQNREIATVVEPAGPFFKAEQYHQNYHAKHGGSCPIPKNP